MLTNKTFIIAEAGVNHNGKIKLAYQLLMQQRKLVQMQLNFKSLKLRII